MVVTSPTLAESLLARFLKDEKHFEMFVTGRAGTGKTTKVASIVTELEATNTSYIVCAHTHKACGILASKLPETAIVKTLHSYLKKRPGINEHATRAQHVSINTKMSSSERPAVVIVDEFSMVGERDYMDLVAMQDPHDGEKCIKTIFVGDLYQLPPVGDLQTIRPKEPYWIKLTKVHRTDRPDLLGAMTRIANMIDGAPVERIESSENFVRNVEIAKLYAEDQETNKVLLAWTNKAVQELNKTVEVLLNGSSKLDGTRLWCPSLRRKLVFESLCNTEEVRELITPVGPLPRNTKYKTLEYLLDFKGITFASFYDASIQSSYQLAFVFGHYDYQCKVKELTERAVAANQAIKQHCGDLSPAVWARANSGTNKAKQRAKAWRALLAFKEAVVCVDFPHAMTIHKSQGSTYNHVYIDTKDLSKCAERNLKTSLSLFYVAVSRAALKVYTT